MRVTSLGDFALLFFGGDVSPRYERSPTQLAMPPVLSAGYGENAFSSLDTPFQTFLEATL